MVFRDLYTVCIFRKAYPGCYPPCAIQKPRNTAVHLRDFGNGGTFMTNCDRDFYGCAVGFASMFAQSVSLFGCSSRPRDFRNSPATCSRLLRDIGNALFIPPVRDFRNALRRSSFRNRSDG
jgi:hypothetical protein